MKNKFNDFIIAHFRRLLLPYYTLYNYGYPDKIVIMTIIVDLLNVTKKYLKIVW